MSSFFSVYLILASLHIRLKIEACPDWVLIKPMHVIEIFYLPPIGHCLKIRQTIFLLSQILKLILKNHILYFYYETILKKVWELNSNYEWYFDHQKPWLICNHHDLLIVLISLFIYDLESPKILTKKHDPISIYLKII